MVLASLSRVIDLGRRHWDSTFIVTLLSSRNMDIFIPIFEYMALIKGREDAAKNSVGYQNVSEFFAIHP